MRSIVCLLLLLYTLTLRGQNSNPNFFYPSPDYNSQKVNGVVITEAVAFTGVMIALHYLWYKKYAHSRFHYFNDNAEWLQMDKMGHATTAYNLGALGTDVYRWTGMQKNQAYWYGGITGLLFLTTIEIFDGFSSGWGFSGGDMLANLAGSALVIGQNMAWDQQRIELKFSYHQTIYPSYRPDELGKNRAESILKDYNGQSYWLSLNIYSVLDSHTTFPKWLNASVGLGADGMISGRVIPSNDSTKVPAFERTRRLFFAPDVDFTRISTNEQGALILFKAINFLKVPAPAIEFRPERKMLKMHLFYY